MNVLLLRHAVAETREEFAITGHPDELRPLSREGRRGMRRIARAINKLVPELTVVATSPLVRTLQTAQMLAAAYPEMEVVELDALAPQGSNNSVLNFLEEHSHLRGVGLVGHEPDLGVLFSEMLVSRDFHFFSFKKGGAALLSFEGRPRVGRAQLEWVIKPGELRALGG